MVLDTKQTTPSQGKHTEESEDTIDTRAAIRTLIESLNPTLVNAALHASLPQESGEPLVYPFRVRKPVPDKVQVYIARLYREQTKTAKHPKGGRLPYAVYREVIQAVYEDTVLSSPMPTTHDIGEGSDLPTVEVGNQLRDVVKSAVDALVLSEQDKPSIFVQSSKLVTIHHTEEGEPTVTPLAESSLRYRLSHSANYVAVRTKGDRIITVSVDPPLDMVKVILSGYNPKDLPFPPLVGITELPILRNDGSIHDVPGYDTVSRYVFIPGNLVVPTIPDVPTDEDVRAARELLYEMLIDFPFSDEASKATVIADIITAVIRSVINGQVPLTLLDAPKQGTGKTLLALLVAIIATGRIVPTNAPTNDEEEWRKKIVTWLLPSPSVVIIDNVIRPLESSSLNSALTSEYVEDRGLGTQSLVRVRNKAVWFATGNNIRVGDDTARRCIKCRLDAVSEKPWKRDLKEFHIANILQWAIEHRGRLVSAVLTLARNWYVQGKPSPDVTPLGSFENWTITVGGILQAASIPGFLANLDDESMDTVDEISRDWKVFIEAIHGFYSDKPFTSAKLAEDLIAETDEAKDLRESVPGTLSEDLDRYMNSKSKGTNFSTHLGRALRQKRDVVYGNLRLQLSPVKSQNKQHWQIVTLDKAKRSTSPNDTPVTDPGETTVASWYTQFISQPGQELSFVDNDVTRDITIRVLETMPDEEYLPIEQYINAHLVELNTLIASTQEQVQTWFNALSLSGLYGLEETNGAVYVVGKEGEQLQKHREYVNAHSSMLKRMLKEQEERDERAYNDDQF